MRLFVLGNISSGKSYFIEKLIKLLPDYKILRIDDYRIHNCDGSLESEIQMWNDFPNEVIKYNDVIVEMSGGGQVAQTMVSLLDNNSFLVIKINTSIELCIERNKNKDFSKIPYPKQFSININDIIKKIGANINSGAIEKLWSKAIKIYDLPSDYDVLNLPLYQYHELFKLDRILKKIKGSLFTFGSIGRGNMKLTSDVDTYFLTNLPFEKIGEILKENFNEVRFMANEFVIRYNGILIEMNYIQDINDAALFYNRSLIANPYKTILQDDFNIIDKLLVFAKEKIDIEKEIKFTIERLNYYVESLSTLIKKQDDYKYYFHNNIIVHEYVKLKAFLKNVFDFSYLPLQAKQYLTDEEWANILYSFGDDQKLHYTIVRKMADDIILKFKC